MPKKYGYFIIELLVIISILCLFATMSISNFGFLTRFKLRSEFDLLCSTFDYLKKSSIADNKEYCLTFDREKNCYNFENTCHFLPKGITFGIVPGSSYLKPNNYLHNPITFYKDRVTFYSTGIVQSGIVCLVDSSLSVMYCLSSAVSQISILRKYRYDGQWNTISIN